MRTETITRTEANRYNMRKRCTYGVISDGCVGVWGDGTNERTAIESAKKYFRSNKKDFYREDENGKIEFNIDKIMHDCYMLRVENFA